MEVQIQTEEVRYLEDYLKQSGWGVYGKFIIAIGCISNLIHSIAFTTMAYTVALSSSNQLVIPENNAFNIFTLFLIGNMIGGIISNTLADRYGRKRFLVYSFIFMFFSSFTAAFAYNIYVLLMATLTMGMGLETNITQIRILIIEVLDRKKRGLWMTVCNISWIFGYALTTCLLILLESSVLMNNEIGKVATLTTWRTMWAATGGFSLLMACICALLEESPRYYLLIGRNYLAFLLLKQLYAINKSSFAENYKVREDELNNLINSYDLHYAEPIQYWQILKKCCWRFWKSLKFLFSKRFLKITLLLIAFKIPFLTLGVFSLNISLAKLINFNNETNSVELTGLDFIYPVKGNAISDNSQSSLDFYKNIMILSCAALFGQIMCMLLIDTLGRKFILFIGLLVSSLILFTYGFVGQNKIENINIIALCIILIFLNTAISVTFLINLEVYPTAIRSTSTAVTNMAGYLIAIFYINFIAIDSRLFAILLGSVYFSFSILTCFLPETKGKPLEE